MIKNDFNEKLANEFLLSIESLNSNLNRVDEDIEFIYKKFLGFNKNFILNLSWEDQVDLLVNKRINDYTKVCIIGILFFKTWELSKNERDFNLLIRSFNILNYMYMNDGQSGIKNYKEFLFKICDRICEYEVDVELKTKIVKIYFKENMISKVDDIIFDVLDNDSSFKDEGINMYKKMIAFDDDLLKSNNMEREELVETLNTICKKYN